MTPYRFWQQTNVGRRILSHLPEVIDTVGAEEYCGSSTEIIIPGEQPIWGKTRPANGYGLSIAKRLYFCYLILINRATAVQYLEDHIDAYKSSMNL